MAAKIATIVAASIRNKWRPLAPREGAAPVVVFRKGKKKEHGLVVTEHTVFLSLGFLGSYTGHVQG